MVRLPHAVPCLLLAAAGTCGRRSHLVPQAAARVPPLRSSRGTLVTQPEVAQISRAKTSKVPRASSSYAEPTPKTGRTEGHGAVRAPKVTSTQLRDSNEAESELMERLSRLVLQQGTSRRSALAGAALATNSPAAPSFAAAPKVAAFKDTASYAVLPDTTEKMSPTTTKISATALVEALSAPEKRVIFLGEHHDSKQDHLLQEGIIRSLRSVSPRGKEMAVGLESFQRRFQPVLDDYVAGRIGEDQLFQRTEWQKRWFWPFDNYLPVFRACRELRVPLIALNVDSEDLSEVEVGGLPALPVDALSRYVPDKKGFAGFARTAAYKQYVDYVITPSYAMHQRMGILRTTITGRKLTEDMTFRNFFSGRILWDEGMASASVSWLNKNPNGLLVAIIGSDHVKFGCGVSGRTARQLQGGLASTASVLLNTRPRDTFPDVETAQGYADYVLQLPFAPAVTGQPSDAVIQAASQQQTRPGSPVLPLADFLLLSAEVQV